MSHRASNDWARANALQELVIADPGASGTFDLQGNFWSRVTVSNTGTYTLPDADPGTTLLVCIDDASTVTLADSTGTVAVVVGTSGTTAARCTATDSNSWAVEVVGVTSGGAAEIGIADAAGYYTTDTVESALSQVGQHLRSAAGWQRGIALSTFREVTSGGDPGNAAAIGGVLASDTTPIFLADAAEALSIQWAASNSDIIASTVDIPTNMDGGADIFVELLVQSAGTTNAPSFSVLTNFNGGAQITDTATGSASASIQTITATIAAADVPAAAMVASIQLVPGAHTTDAWSLYGVRVYGKQTLLDA